MALCLSFATQNVWAAEQKKSCEEQLVFKIEEITPLSASVDGFVVLAPRGNPHSIGAMRNIHIAESKKAGFTHKVGFSNLEEDFAAAVEENLIFRIAQLRPLVTGEIQLALYEGRIEKFKRLSFNSARLTLAKGKQRVELNIGAMDGYFVRPEPFRN